MFTIRAEQVKKDIASIREVNLLAFNGEGEAKLVEAIRQSDNFVPELSLVAVKDASGEGVAGAAGAASGAAHGTAKDDRAPAVTREAVIGHILFSLVGIETAQGLVSTLGLAPMAVRPEYQNQGIGSALVQTGLERARHLGFEHVVVLGHPNFYPKFGFVPSKRKGILPPFPVRDEVFMVCELKEGALTGIEGTVKYPPAFDHV